MLRTPGTGRATRRLPGALLTRRTRSGSGGVGWRLWLLCKRWGWPSLPPRRRLFQRRRPSVSRHRLRAAGRARRPCNGATAEPARRPRAGRGCWHRVLAPGWLCWSAPVLCHTGGIWRKQLALEATVHRPMSWSGDVSGLPEEGFPRKSEAPGLGPCPLPATVAILALLPFNYRPRQAWPRVPLHYAIAIGAAPPSRPAPVDN